AWRLQFIRRLLQLHQNSNRIIQSNIKHLRSLRLSYVDVEEGTIEYIIFNCPLLGELAVDNAKSLHNLRIEGSSSSSPPLALKYLEVRDCFHLISMEIDHAPNLTHLVHTAYAGQLECLSLELDPYYLDLPNMVELSSLEQLKIQVTGRSPDYSILDLVPLINTSPRLHTLRVEVLI
ncbi:hypothetical protein LINPERHAP1_LOCUS31654, partial [Linum perenne]